MKKVFLMLSIAFVISSCGKKNELEPNTSKADSIATKEIKTDTVPSFTKELSLNKISFKISVTGNQMTITPSGLSIDNNPIIREIEGTVTNAEIGDLNSDTFPEVFIYTNSDGSGSYGKAYGFSVNNGKSVSDISIPNVTDIPKLSKGYMGHDDFAIVEGILAQRFPIYNEGDTNSNPTGKTRQIQYKLRDVESSRVLVVDQTIEF
ncbi:PliI family lysozyme inhibitor of I-type lysozyme [Flavobacterium sp.]|uniref:PliI family lysozyme inhibitor of I-type lysozyme n=1 Tax=Flavobacterium sp. TaxID=239 RepID=UPI003918D5F8